MAAYYEDSLESFRLSPFISHCHTYGLSCQVTWQVMWPPHGHRHTGIATLGRVTCRVTCRAMWWVMCPSYVSAPLTMGTHQGPLAQGTLGGLWPLWHLRPLLSDITNKGLPNGVLSTHLRFIWLVERFAWIEELCCNTAPQCYQTWE